MKAVIMPTLTCFGRARSRTKDQIRQPKQIVNCAAQRCLGIHQQWQRTSQVNAALIRELVPWEPFEHALARQSWQWLDHVARMPKERFPKQALLGFWKDHPTKTHPPWRQGQWLKH